MTTVGENRGAVKRIGAKDARRRQSSTRYAAPRKFHQSGSQPFVAIRETTNLWKGNNLACLGGLYWPWHGTVLALRRVSARLVTVIQIGSENAPQMPYAQDDKLIQALFSDRTDRPFDIVILPWQTRCRDDFVDAHGLDPCADHQPIDAVPMPDHVVWCRVPREGFCHLLLDPGRCRMSRHTDMQDPPSLVLQHDEHVQEPECRGGDVLAPQRSRGFVKPERAAIQVHGHN